MVGTTITDLTRVWIGNFGYTVKVNANDLLANKITEILATKDSGNTTNVTAEVSLATLQGYLNSQSCPLLAFNHSYGELTIFFRGDGSDSPAWTANHEYAIGDIVKNAAGTRRLWCTVAGKSGAVEPTFPSSGTVDDEILVDDTTADIHTATTIGKDSYSWTPDAYIGETVEIVSGKGVGQTREILDNDDDEVTVDTWDTTPDATSVFRIVRTENVATWTYLDEIPRGDSLPYESGTVFVVSGFRNPQATTSDSDKLDVPDRDLELVKAYAREMVWQMKKNVVPRGILDKIRIEEGKIRNE